MCNVSIIHRSIRIHSSCSCRSSKWRARWDSNPRFWALFALKSMAPKAHVLVLARLRARGHTQITSSFIALGYPTRTRVPCKSKKSRSKRLNSSIRSGVKPDFSVTVVLGAYPVHFRRCLVVNGHKVRVVLKGQLVIGQKCCVFEVHVLCSVGVVVASPFHFLPVNDDDLVMHDPTERREQSDFGSRFFEFIVY